MYLAGISEHAGLWPCARQEGADPSLWTGERENTFPLLLAASWRKGSEAFLPESERHCIPQLSDTIHYGKTKQNKPTLNYSRENPGK